MKYSCFILLCFISIFHAFASSDPVDPVAESNRLLSRAIVASVSNQLARERQLLEQATALNPNNLAAWQRLTALLQRTLNERESAPKPPPESISLEAPPPHPDLHLDGHSITFHATPHPVQPLVPWQGWDVAFHRWFDVSLDPLLHFLTEKHANPSPPVGFHRIVTPSSIPPFLCSDSLPWCLLFAAQPDVLHFTDPRISSASAQVVPSWQMSNRRHSIHLSAGSVLLFPAPLQCYLLANRESPRDVLVFPLSEDAKLSLIASFLNVHHGTPTVESAWQTTIWTGVVQHPEALNDALSAQIRRIATVDQPHGVRKSNRQGYQTRADLFDRYSECDAFNVLHARLLQSLRDYIGSTSSDDPARKQEALVIHQSWAGINPKSAENVVHVHPESMVSGVYYVSIPDYTSSISSSSSSSSSISSSSLSSQFFVSSPSHISTQDSDTVPGSICLLDPRERFRYHPAFALNSRICLQPVAGQILLFPSWIEHFVTPHFEDSDRIMIAFNVNPI